MTAVHTATPLRFWVAHKVDFRGFPSALVVRAYGILSIFLCIYTDLPVARISEFWFLSKCFGQFRASLHARKAASSAAHIRLGLSP